jgi:hypothetical protein
MGSKITRAPLPPVISFTRAMKSSLSVAITCAAPTSTKGTFFLDVRVVAMLIAPSAFAISMAAIPTLLLAAVITMKSFFCDLSMCDQCSIGCQILHSNGSALFRRQLLWINRQRTDRNNRRLSIDAVVRHEFMCGLSPSRVSPRANMKQESKPSTRGGFFDTS